MQHHKKWMVGAVILMLLGMFLYVISNDEADPPGPDQTVEQTAE